MKELNGYQILRKKLEACEKVFDDLGVYIDGMLTLKTEELSQGKITVAEYQKILKSYQQYKSITNNK